MARTVRADYGFDVATRRNGETVFSVKTKGKGSTTVLIAYYLFLSLVGVPIICGLVALVAGALGGLEAAIVVGGGLAVLCWLIFLREILRGTRHYFRQTVVVGPDWLEAQGKRYAFDDIDRIWVDNEAVDVEFWSTNAMTAVASAAVAGQFAKAAFSVKMLYGSEEIYLLIKLTEGQGTKLADKLARAMHQRGWNTPHARAA